MTTTKRVRPNFDDAYWQREVKLHGYITGNAAGDRLVVWNRQFPVLGDDSRVLLSLDGKRLYTWGHDHRHEKVEVKIEIKVVPPTKPGKRRKP